MRTARVRNSILFTAIFFLSGCARFTLDRESLAQTHSVAIVSMYGPTILNFGVNHVVLQPTYDALNEYLAEQLEARKFSVVSRDKVAAAIDANFKAEYGRSLTTVIGRPMGPDSADFLAGFKGMVLGKVSFSAGGTDVAKYFARKNTQWADSSTDIAALSALSKVTGSMPADAFVVVRLIPGVKTNLKVTKSAQTGLFGGFSIFGDKTDVGDIPQMTLQIEVHSKDDIVTFRDVVHGESDTLGVSGYKTAYDKDAVQVAFTAAGKKAIDNALNDL